jgi:type VI protein secretion system component VasA
MFDELHAYYNRELAYLRRLAAAFAEQHPTSSGCCRALPSSPLAYTASSTTTSPN